MAVRATLHPNIHRIILSQALSKLGDNFTEVALAIFVLAMTHNVADLGIVLAMVYLPRVVLGWAVAGIVDRLPRRRALVVSDISRALIVSSIPVIHDYLWTIIAVFLMYSFAMVYQPILRSVQPTIAGSSEVNSQSMARQETYYAITDIAAYLLAAAVIFSVGLSYAFWIDGVTYLGASLFILGVRVDKTIWAPPLQGVVKFWGQIQEGFQFIRKNRLVGGLTILSAILSLSVGGINTMLAAISKGMWHVSTDHYVWIVLVVAIGAFLSGVSIERLNLVERVSHAALLTFGMLLSGLGIGLVLLTHSWWTGLLCVFLSGLGQPLYGTALMVWIQQSAPSNIRTRVLAIRGIGLGIGGAIGAAGAGWLARQVGVPMTVGMVSVLWIVMAVVTITVFSTTSSKARETVA